MNLVSPIVRNYLLPLLATLLLLAVLVSGFNWLINPMGVFSSPVIPGLNLVRSNMFAYDRQFKAWGILKQKPDGLILGTSRASVGMNPEHPGWQVDHVFNSGLTASSPYLAYRYLQHAMATRPLKQVVVGLDFIAFNSSLADTIQFDESLLRVTAEGHAVPDYFLNRQLQSLYSLHVAQLSMGVIEDNRVPRNRTVDPAAYRPPLSQNGVMQPDSFLRSTWLPHRVRAYNTIKQYLTQLWAPLDKFELEIDGVEGPLVVWHRRFLREAYASGADVRLFISPSHAYLFEGIAAGGLWDRWESWKRLMVKINAEEASRAGKAAFPLWDFSGYNEYSSAEASTEAGSDNGFEYFWDPGHYRQTLGDLVLDRVLSGARPNGFGVLLDESMLDQHLANIRRDRAAYRAASAVEVAELDLALAAILNPSAE